MPSSFHHSGPFITANTPEPGTPAPAAPPIEMLDADPSPWPDAKGFGPGFAGGIVSLRYELRTRHVRQCYRRDFLHLSQLLNGLDRARNFRGVPPDIVDRAEQSVTRCLHDTQALLADLTRRTELLLARDGMSDIPIHYIDPIAVHAPITNPRARLYMDMLTAADQAFSALERAWLFGLIDTRARRTHEAALRKAVRAVSGTIRGEYTQMARRLRGEPVAASDSDSDSDSGCDNDSAIASETGSGTANANSNSNSNSAGTGTGTGTGRDDPFRLTASSTPHRPIVRAVP
ncbi:MAG: hypothetical protein ACM32J_11230 [Rhizobacter sp.]